MRLTIYGCRGSAASVHGDTSCYKITAKNTELILDAGSGLLRHEAKPSNILISHLHLDHIIGLSAYAPIWNKNGGARIFTQSRDAGKSLTSQVFGAFKPPYWPVPIEKVTSAKVRQIFTDETFSPDGIFTVTPFEGNHPDLTSSFKITDGEKSLIYLLDYEIGTLSAASYGILAETCRGADMIVFDSTYHPNDYEAHRGFGHSTPVDGIKLADDSGACRMLFTHFDPRYDGAKLASWNSLLKGVKNPERFIFARDEMEISI